MDSAASATFSESWHRVANQRICLRPGVRVRRQNFRGERWYVLENPFTNQYFRVRPEAYEFVARLRPEVTVQALHGLPTASGTPCKACTRFPRRREEQTRLAAPSQLRGKAMQALHGLPDDVKFT